MSRRSSWCPVKLYTQVKLSRTQHTFSLAYTELHLLIKQLQNIVCIQILFGIGGGKLDWNCLKPMSGGHSPRPRIVVVGHTSLADFRPQKTNGPRPSPLIGHIYSRVAERVSLKRWEILTQSPINALAASTTQIASGG